MRISLSCGYAWQTLTPPPDAPAFVCIHHSRSTFLRGLQHTRVISLTYQSGYFQRHSLIRLEGSRKLTLRGMSPPELMPVTSTSTCLPKLWCPASPRPAPDISWPTSAVKQRVEHPGHSTVAQRYLRIYHLPEQDLLNTHFRKSCV